MRGRAAPPYSGIYRVPPPPRGLQCPCIYRIELADSQREIATKDIQEAVDNAGISGHIKIF